MPQAWTALTGDDLWQVVSRSVVEQVDEDSEGGTKAGNDFDADLDTRAKKAVERAVKQIRSAIENAGCNPLSLTPNSVPPEAEQYALAIAAYWLVMPVPSLLAVVMGDGGVYSPLGSLYKEGQAWIKSVLDGAQVVDPTDPTGRDYLTAPSDTNLAVDMVRNGEIDEAAPNWNEPA